jgi:hypothetical protein
MMRYKGLKGKAWEAVKLYVRAKETDCYTCGAKELVSFNAQAGHFLAVGIVGSNNRLSWDETQLHLQCGRCNGVGQGEQVAYRAHLVKDYGEATVKALEARKKKIDPIKNWQAIIDHFTNLRKAL